MTFNKEPTCREEPLRDNPAAADAKREFVRRMLP
jgi:hypothetical protein